MFFRRSSDGMTLAGGSSTGGAGGSSTGGAGGSSTGGAGGSSTGGTSGVGSILGIVGSPLPVAAATASLILFTLSTRLSTST